ncbi:MAG: alkylation response protein AidB-like acyl-CoA dehydrogenase [Parasphingorhabdus sp.]|jgi:alkylation response protein AidB-like acyl-CoA dehydrogenase
MTNDKHIFDLNSETGAEQQAVVDAVDRFAQECLAPMARTVDETSEFAGCHIPAMSKVGLMGMNLPEQWGGLDISAQTLLEAVAAVAGACGSTASLLTAHFLATDAILLGGDDAQRQRYLPDSASGKKLGAFALTESDAGSNPADMRVQAIAEQGGYRIQGSKQFISNGGAADYLVVFALTDPDAGHRGISAFIVDSDTQGFTAGPAEKTMGLKGGHVFPLQFDCFVPTENRLGGEGSGFRTAMRVLDNGRLEVAAMCIGIARAALNAATNWAKERQISGKPVSNFQGIQWMIADMATQLEAATLMARNAACKRSLGEGFSKESAMAKVFASEMADKVTDLALQIHGGYGYSRDFPLERYVRDVRIMRIYEGSSEIQRNIIARHVLSD